MLAQHYFCSVITGSTTLTNKLSFFRPGDFKILQSLLTNWDKFGCLQLIKLWLSTWYYCKMKSHYHILYEYLILEVFESCIGPISLKLSLIITQQTMIAPYTKHTHDKVLITKYRCKTKTISCNTRKRKHARDLASIVNFEPPRWPSLARGHGRICSCDRGTCKERFFTFRRLGKPQNKVRYCV